MAKNDTVAQAEASVAKVQKAESTSAAGKAVAAEVAAEQLSFDQWWMTMSKKLKLLGHMKEILQADFAARGLTKNETKHKFDNAMKLFGYKW